MELDQVETDYCSNCSGIWLDAGELELLFEDKLQGRTLINSFEQVKSPREQLRLCPICLKKMHKVLTSSGNETVMIDRCSGGHGLWFDRGELAQILAKGGFDKENKVVKLLSDMFSHNESEGKNGD